MLYNRTRTKDRNTILGIYIICYLITQFIIAVTIDIFCFVLQSKYNFATNFVVLVNNELVVTEKDWNYLSM